MNRLKAALAEGRPALGLWQALANAYTAEICAAAGFDWLLFDGEHAPNTLPTLIAQLQAVAPYPLEPIARPPQGDAVSIKQYLDIGFRTLLVPMVDDAEQASAVVAATRFPPRGIRGVASATSRASMFGANSRYLQEAHQHVFLIVQIESRAALEHIEEIAAVDGVDALFVGPGDLAGSLGHLGNPGHPEVQGAIADALARVDKAGKPAGVFATSPDQAHDYIAAGASFLSVGTDIGLLSKGARELIAQSRSQSK